MTALQSFISNHHHSDGIGASADEAVVVDIGPSSIGGDDTGASAEEAVVVDIGPSVIYIKYSPNSFWRNYDNMVH